jgi:hypothetical protein
MKPLVKKNIIVAGTPGAWINVIAGLLNERGWQITWPGQDIDIRDGQLFHDHNKQNIEVQNIHYMLCSQHGCQLVSADLPKFYGTPFPGPKEFIERFDKPAVISGTCMSPFLDLWVETADVVISIEATPEEDVEMLNKWTHNKRSERQLQDIRDVHVERYNEHLKLFPKVFTMSNAEVRDRRVDGLVRFLNSVF